MTRFYNIFKNVNLSVDTDLTFIVPCEDQMMMNAKGPDYTTFRAFDVYNNGWLIGGQLNISSNYELMCNSRGCHKSKYLSDLYKRGVSGNREALRDVTMRVAVVVRHVEMFQNFRFKKSLFRLPDLI